MCRSKKNRQVRRIEGRIIMKLSKKIVAAMLAAMMGIGSVTPVNVKADETKQTEAKDNQTMMQYFEWYLSSSGDFWNKVSDEASDIAGKGFTSVWLPPACKATNTGDVGYGIYDLYDLGEFMQKGSVRTKYGTKSQYLNAIDSLHKNGVKVYADVVLNHKASADARETVNAVSVAGSNRNNENGEVKQISSWSVFNFTGRNNKYSDFKWNASCFDGVDYDALTGKNAIYKFEGKEWDKNVDSENGNYDYLMYCDVDFDNEAVVNELKNWGKWYTEEANLDGFRLDAVKHIDTDFYKNWLTDVRKETGKDLFSVGEYWSGDVNKLTKYIENTEGTTSLFDVALHYNLYKASTSKYVNYDMRKIFDNTLVKADSEHAVTFVDNHDSEPGQSLASYVSPWFKPIAYTLILARKDGYPCVFYGDYYGINKSGYTDSFQTEIDKLMVARTKCAYGVQWDYFTTEEGATEDVIGWTLTGDDAHKNSGLAAVVSDGKAGEIRMYVGANHSGEKWQNIFGDTSDVVTISDQGFATFKVSEKSAAVYINKVNIPVDITKGKITTDKKSYTYTGKAVKPKVKVVYNGKTLVKDVDYTITYSDNVQIGKGKFQVKGIGKNIGTYDGTFDLVPAKVTGMTVKTTKNTVSLTWKKVMGSITGYKVYMYDNAKKRYIYVKNIENSNTTNYDLTGRKSANIYKMYVVAYKKVNGKVYESDKVNVSACTIPETVKYSFKKSGSKLTVKWNKVSNVDGYIIYYKNSSNAKYKKLATVKPSKSSYSKTVSRNKKYYIKVVGYKKNGKITVCGK